MRGAPVLKEEGSCQSEEFYTGEDEQETTESILLPPPTKKKNNEISYTYWKRDVCSNNEPAPMPEKVENLPETEAEAKVSSSRPSLWNSTGNTWEERDVSKQFNIEFGGLLAKFLMGKGFPVTGVESDECKASICFIRRKPKLGYEVSFTVNLKDAADARVCEFCEYDDSFTLRVGVDCPISGESLREALTEFRQVLPEQFFALC